MRLGRVGFALGFLTLALAVPAASPTFAGAGSASFTIHAVVPTICRVEYDGGIAPVAGQTTDLGQITELCNDADGYQVVLVTPAGLTGSAAILDGTTIPLAANGQTVIVDSNSDAFKKQDLKIQLAASAPAFGTVQFATTPKGAIY